MGRIRNGSGPSREYLSGSISLNEKFKRTSQFFNSASFRIAPSESGRNDRFGRGCRVCFDFYCRSSLGRARQQSFNYLPNPAAGRQNFTHTSR